MGNTFISRNRVSNRQAVPLRCNSLQLLEQARIGQAVLAGLRALFPLCDGGVRDTEGRSHVAERELGGGSDAPALIRAWQLPAGSHLLQKLVDAQFADSLWVGVPIPVHFHGSYTSATLRAIANGRLPIANTFHTVYAASVTRERAIARLELVRATVSGQKGWVAASWRRADGSKGSVTVRFLLKDERRFFLAQLLVDAPTSGFLRDIPLARIEQAANVDPQIRHWIWDSFDLEVDAQGRPIWKRHRLRRPSGRRLDDAFYARVATAYL